MTAPLTPPPPPSEPSPNEDGRQPAPHAADDPVPHDIPDAPGRAPGHPGSHGTHDGFGRYEQNGPSMKTELREAVTVTALVALSGALLGVLWWWLAPSVPLVGDLVNDRWVVYFQDSEGEQVIGVDGTFTLLAGAFGLVSGVAVALWRRRGGVPLVIGLAVGAFLGALLAWWLGVRLGPTEDVIAHAKEAGRNVAFPAPLKLEAKGALLAWPFAALLVHLGLTGLFGPREVEPFPQPRQDPPAAPGA